MIYLVSHSWKFMYFITHTRHTSVYDFRYAHIMYYCLFRIPYSCKKIHFQVMNILVYFIITCKIYLSPWASKTLLHYIICVCTHIPIWIWFLAYRYYVLLFIQDFIFITQNPFLSYEHFSTFHYYILSKSNLLCHQATLT